jgi:hypothetical protein
MSLDFDLIDKKKTRPAGSGIFVRENGATREITREEWEEKHPGQEPVTFQGEEESNCVYSGNITHNLGKMANEAGIYKVLWRPEELGYTKGGELIETLEEGLKKLKGDPEHYKTFNASNGWGLYEHFVPFVEEILAACKEYPDAEIYVSR